MTALIQVPASASNLGAGFDCIGVAVDLWLHVSAALQDRSAGWTVCRAGTLTTVDCAPADDRLVAGFAAACAAAGAACDHGVSFNAHSSIPVGRGLGSSAAATLAGALAANALLQLALDDDALLAACSDVEGHADNVAPALAGGATLVARRRHGGYLVTPVDVHPDIALVFAVPDFVLETRRARAVLPEFVPHRTAAGAVARAASLVRGLSSGDERLLALGLDDVLHVPFRRRLVPGYGEVTAAARAAGAFGATLSGSGSAIVALAPAARAPAVADAMRAAWAAHGIEAEVIQPSIVREVACR